MGYPSTPTLDPALPEPNNCCLTQTPTTTPPQTPIQRNGAFKNVKREAGSGSAPPLTKGFSGQIEHSQRLSGCISERERKRPPVCHPQRAGSTSSACCQTQVIPECCRCQTNSSPHRAKHQDLRPRAARTQATAQADRHVTQRASGHVLRPLVVRSRSSRNAADTRPVLYHIQQNIRI